MEGEDIYPLQSQFHGKCFDFQPTAYHDPFEGIPGYAYPNALIPGGETADAGTTAGTSDAGTTAGTTGGTTGAATTSGTTGPAEVPYVYTGITSLENVTLA